ncbi:MAG: hypothetical protein AAGF77_04740 [Bacteroidota bacterium]
MFCCISNGQDLSRIGDSTAVKLSGGAGLRTIFYSSNGAQERRQPFTYVLSGNAALNVYQLNIPFSFTLSNQQFRFSQPFNEFGASPTYKWATVHLGFRNLNLSRFTLAGHQMLGAGVELNPGKFRFAAMYGRLQKAVAEDTTLLSVRRPAFQRKGYSVKVGFGTNTNFVDFIFLKAEDDEESLQVDTLPETVRPGENTVFGINSIQNFFKNKLKLYFDGGVSLFVLDKTLNGTGIEIPEGLSFLGDLVNANESTQFYTAFRGGVDLNLKNFALKTVVQRIDSDYRSMGLYFINNDILAYSVNPAITFLKGNLRLSGGVTLQRDNLNDKKAFTSKRTIPTANIFVRPTNKLNFMLGYTNVSTLMEEGTIPLDNAFRQDQNNPIYTFSSTYATATELAAHQVSLFANRSQLVDNNLQTSQFSEYVGNTVNLSYSFSQTKQLFGLFASVNYNDLETFNGKLPGAGVSLGGNKSFLEGKLNLNATGSYADQNGQTSQSFNLGAAYRIKKHQISLQTNYLNTQLTSGKFNEFTGFLNYGIRF